MKLEHPQLEKFEPFLRQIVEIAFNSGVRAIESKGFRFQDMQHDQTALKVFIRGCHYGYDKAQQRVGTVVTSLDKEIRAEEVKLKESRRSRGQDIISIGQRVTVLKDRQLVLRRIVDTMVWTILADEEWNVRRLGDDKIRAIDTKVLERTLQVATRRNQETRYNFSVVSDLTTLVHIGDLFEVSCSPGSKKTWRILELKEGKVNAALSTVLEDRTDPLTDKDRNALEKSLGKEAVKQAERMLRQNVSRDQLHKIVETDRGVDYRTKQEITLTSDVAVVEDYEKELAGLIDEAALKGFSCTAVDSCLYVIAIKGDQYRGKHPLIPVFHLLSRPEGYTNDMPTEEIVKEFQELDSKAPIVDLVDLSMRIPCGKPIFYWISIPRPRQVDLAIGHIRVFAYFDIDAFLKSVAATGIKVSWVTGKEAEEARRISPRIPGSPNAYALRVELPNGRVQELMNGFFSRVFLYLTRPSSLLDLAVSSSKCNG